MTDQQLVEFLQALVRTPSLSKQENLAADLVENELAQHGIKAERIGNNVIASHGSGQPSLWLNSHIDTVDVAPGYTFDPHSGEIANGKILGLGSNDAKGSVTALTAAFIRFRAEHPNFDRGEVILIASCEEEIGGEGVKRMRRELPNPSAAIIGEPNHMKPANCCKGVVLAEFTINGESAHVSRPWQGRNALRLASPLIADIVADHQLAGDPALGPATHEPTLIQGGHQKNALPAQVKIFLDCRSTPTFDNEAMKNHLQSIADRHPDCTLEILKDQVTPTRTDPNGKFVQAACSVAGLDMPNPFVGVCDFVYMGGVDAVILGPGAPERSHKADEFLMIDELLEGAKIYQAVLNRYFF